MAVVASAGDGPTLALTEWTWKHCETGVEASVQPKVAFGSPVRGREEQSSGDVSSMAFWGCIAAIVAIPNDACSDFEPRIFTELTTRVITKRNQQSERP
ncbi:hypothetical protein SH467x_001064 [Pirellulaceae bacterium SH467]